MDEKARFAAGTRRSPLTKNQNASLNWIRPDRPAKPQAGVGICARLPNPFGRAQPARSPARTPRSNAFGKICNHLARPFTLSEYPIMSKFDFSTFNTWDIALHHGHTAFRLLKLAYDIEITHTANSSKLKALPQGGTNYVQLVGRNQILEKDMFRICSASIMMFQVMMEALINDSLEREPALASVSKTSPFRKKWGMALQTLQQDTSSFMQYYDGIYKKYRIALTVPTSENLQTWQAISFGELFNGFHSGWDAYTKLYSGLGHALDADAWQVWCQTHNLPHASA